MDAADHKIGTLTDKKFIIYPFLSVQRDFGYSDVTILNNEKERVGNLFQNVSERLCLLKKVRNYYLPEFE